jgi:hypothetical protein
MGRRYWMISSVLLALIACGDDDGDEDEACMPGTSEGCEGEQVCEEVEGDEPACFGPVVISGRVLDLADGMGIEGATVVAVDVNGSARSSVVTSGDDGSYSIGLPTRRTAEGAPIAEPVQLRVAAAGYQPFPSVPREALPIEIEDAAGGDGGTRTVMNALTDVGLLALADAATRQGVIRGNVEHELGQGALVAAVQGDRAVSTAIADLDGAFTLFNVPAGVTTVEAYRAGLAVTPVDVTLEAGDEVEDVVLEGSTEGLTRVTGSVGIVNASGGLVTTVILALESTFDAEVARGAAPPGLRVADVSGAFQIEAVPPGKYAVLAAFENDRLVRDPDEAIAGTDIVHIEIAGGEDEVALEQSFKITEALAVRSPGAEGIDELAARSDPTFVWADDSSEDGYELRVYDGFGELVHEATDIPSVMGSADVSYTWSGAALEPGMIYQFRATSFRATGGGGGDRTYISATEDLRGVFQVATEEASP